MTERFEGKVVVTPYDEEKMRLKERVFVTGGQNVAMDKVVEADSNHVQALNYLAYSLAELNKDLDRAEKLAMRAVQLDPTDAFIKDTLGWVYFQKGQYKKAVDYLEKAHKSLPDVSVIADLGDAYLKLQQIEKAHQTFEKAIGVESDVERKVKIQNKITELRKGVTDRKPASQP